MTVTWIWFQYFVQKIDDGQQQNHVDWTLQQLRHEPRPETLNIKNISQQQTILTLIFNHWHPSGITSLSLILISGGGFGSRGHFEAEKNKSKSIVNSKNEIFFFYFFKKFLQLQIKKYVSLFSGDKIFKTENHMSKLLLNICLNNYSKTQVIILIYFFQVSFSILIRAALRKIFGWDTISRLGFR